MQIPIRQVHQTTSVHLPYQNQRTICVSASMRSFVAASVACSSRDGPGMSGLASGATGLLAWKSGPGCWPKLSRSCGQ